MWLENNEWDLGEWAFANALMGLTTSNDYALGEWAFADQIVGLTTNNEHALGEWAFTVTDASMTADNGGMLARAAANLSPSDESGKTDTDPRLSRVLSCKDGLTDGTGL